MGEGEGLVGEICSWHPAKTQLTELLDESEFGMNRAKRDANSSDKRKGWGQKRGSGSRR